MAMMMGQLYLALRKAGVDEVEASKAAEEVADFQKQLAEVKSDLAVTKAVGLATFGLVAAMFVRMFLT